MYMYVSLLYDVLLYKLFCQLVKPQLKMRLLWFVLDCLTCLTWPSFAKVFYLTPCTCCIYLCSLMPTAR